MIGYLKLNPINNQWYSITNIYVYLIFSYSHLYSFLCGFKRKNTLLHAFLMNRSTKSGLQNHMHEIYNGKIFWFLAALKSFTIQTWHLSSMSTVKLPLLKKISRTYFVSIKCDYLKYYSYPTITYYYWSSKFVLINKHFIHLLCKKTKHQQAV